MFLVRRSHLDTSLSLFTNMETDTQASCIWGWWLIFWLYSPPFLMFKLNLIEQVVCVQGCSFLLGHYCNYYKIHTWIEIQRFFYGIMICFSILISIFLLQRLKWHYVIPSCSVIWANAFMGLHFSMCINLCRTFHIMLSAMCRRKLPVVNFPLLHALWFRLVFTTF